MPHHILVVDPDDAIRELFMEILEGEGYQVLTVATIAAADAALTQQRPDLVIVNYYFDGQPLGGQWLHAVRTEPSTAQLPILMCTGANHALTADTDFFATHQIVSLERPFEIDALLHAVEQLLGRNLLS